MSHPDVLMGMCMQDECVCVAVLALKQIEECADSCSYDGVEINTQRSH